MYIYIFSTIIFVKKVYFLIQEIYSETGYASYCTAEK